MSFLYTAYTANIVSLLQSPTKSIRTLEDLLQSKLELGVDDTVYNRYFFSVQFPANRINFEFLVNPYFHRRWKNRLGRQFTNKRWRHRMGKGNPDL